MATHVLRALLLAFFAGCLFAPGAAWAREDFVAGSTCHLSGPLSKSYDDYAAVPSLWTCDGTRFDASAARHLVRIDLRSQKYAPIHPRYAEFARHEFDHLTVTAIGQDGGRNSKSYAFSEVALGTSSLRSIVEIPEIASPTQAIVFTLDGGQWPEALLDAELKQSPTVLALAGLPHLLAAMLCGLLIAPMLFDLGYYRALREPFPLFHALFCLMAFTQTAAVSGLIPLLTNISFEAELNITFLSLDVMVAATMLFASNFIEGEFLDRRQRRSLLAIAVLAMVNGIATTFLPELFGRWIDHAYFGCYAILLSGYFAILSSAWVRGSRMAPYLVVGFAPLSAIFLIQLATVITQFPIFANFDETWPQNFALLFEVVATALAVADRFVSIKRERDTAVSEKRTLEKLSERDELTGLLNRRALESRYEALLSAGFTAVAVIDIDHFKSINDMYGHPMGDAVLQCAAKALRPAHDDSLSTFRIGGEEFLIMLRGEDAARRAEGCRRALTNRVLAEIEGLDRPVTASMGFLEFGAVAMEAGLDFTTLYSRVDQLLYDAKCAGRNRTVADRLQLFVPGIESEGSGVAAA